MKLPNISLNNLKRRKAKMAFLVIGMVIGITTIVSLFTITTAMKSQVGDKFDEIGSNMTIVPKSDDLSISYGGVTVSGVSFDVKELNSSVIPRIKTIKNKENIATIAPKLLGTVEVEGKKSLIIGVDFPSELKMKKWWKLTGRAPATDQEIILGQTAAQQMGKKPGDLVNIQGKNYTLAAVIQPLGTQEDELILMALPQVQQILAKPNSISFIELSALCNTCPIDDIVIQLQGKLPDADVSASKEAIQARKDIVDRFASFALAISVVVLVIGSLIVFTTMMSSVNERTREIGIFRAIGFRKGHIMTIILLEAMLVSLVGGLIGYLLGMGAAWGVGPAIAQMDLNITWQLPVALGALGLAVLIGILASLSPAWRAAKLDPVEALRFI